MDVRTLGPGSLGPVRHGPVRHGPGGGSPVTQNRAGTKMLEVEFQGRCIDQQLNLEPKLASGFRFSASSQACDPVAEPELWS